MWSLVVSGITSLVGQWLGNKQKESQAKHEAKIEVIKNQATWEQAAIEASSTSWKDEWFTIVLSTPLVAITVGVALNDPTVIDRVQAGFDTLADLPEWYQYLLYVAVLASFGIKGVDKAMELITKRKT